MSYETNAVEDVKYKKDLLVKCIAKIKIIDFLLNLSYDKQIINEKKYLKFAAKLDDIAKFMNGWLKTMNGRENGSISNNNRIDC